LNDSDKASLPTDRYLDARLDGIVGTFSERSCA
jgi:hypothetical protein